MKYRVSVVSHIGNVRTVNQDNFYFSGRYRSLDESTVAFDSDEIDENKLLTAVFDGMGGKKDGEIASFIASKLISDCVDECISIDIGNTIMSINNQICKEMANRKCHMGSTCVFLEFKDDKCRSWNIGDSRAYHYRNGVLKQISEDHTEAVSFSELFKGQAVAKAGRENQLTQHLGIPEDDFIIEPSVSSWENIEPGDIMMLCSDGLTHMTDDETIAYLLSRNADLQNKRSLLLDRALESGGMDNITIILVEAY